MNYSFSFDKNYLLRSRYLSGKQISQLLPLYGREHRTQHPAITLFNRSGEPLTFDPFNMDDKDFNSHLLLLGTTVWKIATGFDTSFSTFLEKSHSPSKTQGQPRQTQPLHPQDDKIRVKTLFPFDEKLNCEIFMIELLPGCEHLSLSHKQGVIEHVMVASGTMEVLLEGAPWRLIRKGEGLRFYAHQPHGYRNKSKKIASFHNIIHYPPKGK